MHSAVSDLSESVAPQSRPVANVFSHRRMKEDTSSEFDQLKTMTKKQKKDAKKAQAAEEAKKRDLTKLESSNPYALLST